MTAQKPRDTVKIIEKFFWVILFLFFLFGVTVMPHLARQSELKSSKEWIAVHGQECIKKAKTIKDGYKFSLCHNGFAPTDGTFGYFLVYDTSDEIALPPEHRNEEWIYSVLKAEYGMITMKPKWHQVEGHFYSGGWAQHTAPDVSFSNFAKKYECTESTPKDNISRLSCPKFKD